MAVRYDDLGRDLSRARRRRQFHAHEDGLAPFLVQLRVVWVYFTVILTFLSAIPYLRMARGVLSQTSVPTS